MQRNIYKILFILTIIFSSCNEGKVKNSGEEKTESKTVVSIPVFNEDSAYQSISTQVSFGPRVPGTAAHAKCADYIINTLKKNKASVFVQEGKVKTFDGKQFNIKNIIASYVPNATKRILLAAHWDTRPFADQDEKDQNRAIDGANDGGSGTAVLLEIARLMSIQNPGIGVDLIFFDLEDYGQPEDSKFPMTRDSYCLGSQYWANNPPIANYRPEFGILLDMVGGENAQFKQEEVSRTFAPKVLELVWKKAADAGYSSYFSYEQTPAIVDDHYYVNTIGRIPMIDIIHHDAGSNSGFWRHWHTHEDKLENIDKKSLKAVGQTMMQLIYTM